MKKFLILLLLLISSCSDNQSNNKFIENEYPPRLQIESRLYKISDSEIDNVWFYTVHDIVTSNNFLVVGTAHGVSIIKN